MSTEVRLALAVFSIGATVLLAIAAFAAALWADLDAGERGAAALLFEPRVIRLLALAALAAAAAAIAFAPFLRRSIGTPAKLAEQTRILLGANRAYRLAEPESASLRALAVAINELAGQRDALHDDVEERIRAAQASLEEEHNRLVALMSELTQGIVACNLDGLILLYNERARLISSVLAEGRGAGALIGLARPIHALIDKPLIDHALDTVRLRLAGARQRALATFVTAGGAGQLIRVQMAPVLAAHGGDALSGYVLVMEDITRSFEAESLRDRALDALTEGSRASLANIRAAVETLAAYPDIERAERERFIGVIGEEARLMSERLEATAERHAEALKARWVLDEMRGADLVAAAQKAIEGRLGTAPEVEPVDAALWVKADSYTLVRALAWVASRLADSFGVRRFTLRMTRAERLARLDLAWPKSDAPLADLAAWDREPMRLDAGPGALTLHDVAEGHGGVAWFQHDAQTSCCRLLVPLAEPGPETVEAGNRRSESHDFALFERAPDAHAHDERALSELTYTVFDTETTGLAPGAGDEIVQIGAVRVVNLKLLRGETFDQLVDPGRELRAAAVRIHGIDDAMLRGKPAIDAVLPAFRAFCADTVLVAHNAAFDMRFLRIKEASSGVRFDQPLLDTLLLSEVIHAAQDSHRLEAICERLGVAVEARHDALGDALLTAQVWVRMVGLLEAAGVRTLRQAREAAARTRYARVQY